MFDNSKGVSSKGLSFHENKENFPEYHWNDTGLSMEMKWEFLNFWIFFLDEYERLVKEKQYLIQTGDYTLDDPLIMELDKQIMGLKKK